MDDLTPPIQQILVPSQIFLEETKNLMVKSQNLGGRELHLQTPANSWRVFDPFWPPETMVLRGVQGPSIQYICGVVKFEKGGHST